MCLYEIHVPGHYFLFMGSSLKSFYVSIWMCHRHLSFSKQKTELIVFPSTLSRFPILSYGLLSHPGASARCWKRSLHFPGRHSFFSLLSMSYPLGVQAQEHLSLSQCPFPPHLHGILLPVSAFLQSSSVLDS